MIRRFPAKKAQSGTKDRVARGVSVYPYGHRRRDRNDHVIYFWRWSQGLFFYVDKVRMHEDTKATVLLPLPSLFNHSTKHSMGLLKHPPSINSRFPHFPQLHSPQCKPLHCLCCPKGTCRPTQSFLAHVRLVGSRAEVREPTFAASALTGGASTVGAAAASTSWT